MKKLSIVIVNFNTREILKKCLDNLRGIYPDMEVIVVDNNSTDGSADMIKRHFSDIRLIQTQNNGLAAGSNLGLRATTGDYILYLGSDAFPEKNSLVEMIDFMDKEPKLGVATCKLVLRSGDLDMDAHRGFPTPWAAVTHFLMINKVFPKSNFFNRYFLGHEDLTKPHEIDLCISHFMLIKREVFRDVGEWDQNFYVYGEDVDFCYRVKHAGWKIMYLPQWKCLHYKGVSVGIRKETRDISRVPKEVKEKMRRETTRAMRLFYEKHYKNKYPRFITQLVLLGIDILGLSRNLVYE